MYGGARRTVYGMRPYMGPQSVGPRHVSGAPVESRGISIERNRLVLFYICAFGNGTQGTKTGMRKGDTGKSLAKQKYTRPIIQE